MVSGNTVKAVIFDIGGVVVRSPLIAISAYEVEKGLPKDYINTLITRRGPTGAWQRFERGEMRLFGFYDAFGADLSDTVNGNKWYREYCERRKIPVPNLPSFLKIDGRELFGRMMRESQQFDLLVVGALRKLRDLGQYRLIALTNNFANMDALIHPLSPDDPKVRLEMEYLGWGAGGPTPPTLRNLFDDFVDSSDVGLRKPDPKIYLLTCERNGVRPEECVFLDDLGMNLKAAQELGMQTIRVLIDGSREAIQELGQRLGGVDLIGAEKGPSHGMLELELERRHASKL